MGTYFTKLLSTRCSDTIDITWNILLQITSWYYIRFQSAGFMWKVLHDFYAGYMLRIIALTIQSIWRIGNKHMWKYYTRSFYPWEKYVQSTCENITLDLSTLGESMCRQLMKRIQISRIVAYEEFGPNPHGYVNWPVGWIKDVGKYELICVLCSWLYLVSIVRTFGISIFLRHLWLRNQSEVNI